jgi:hypothetical protein
MRRPARTPYGLLLGALLLHGCERGAEPIQDTPPGTVPVPGAASPVGTPDPHPVQEGPDEAYPGTVLPGTERPDTIPTPGR